VASPDPRIETTIAHFCEIYLGGIPPIITNDSAFLSFINVLAAIEALAGFRFADEVQAGNRFRGFVEAYFPPVYRPHADRMWRFRCRMIHAFSPAGFSFTHHHSENHFRYTENGNPILNAEDFYAALVTAAQSYFAELRADAALQGLLITRIEDRRDGGSIGVGPLRFAGDSSSGPDGATTQP
jgi:hypothetical protein